MEHMNINALDDLIWYQLEQCRENPSYIKKFKNGDNLGLKPRLRELLIEILVEENRISKELGESLKGRVKEKDSKFHESNYIGYFDLSYDKWAKKFTDKGFSVMDFERLYKDAKSEGKEGIETFWDNLVTLLGHEWEIKAKLKLGADEKIHTEGYDQIFALGRLGYSVEKFFNNLPEEERPAHADKFIEAFQLGPIYARDKRKTKEIIERIKASEPTVMATGWKGHATYLVFFGDYVAYVNLGDRSEQLKSGITIYKFDNKELLTKEIIKQIQDKQAEKQGSGIGKTFLENTESKKSLFKKLDLRKKATIQMPDQITGNCTWAAASGAFLSLLVLSKKISTSSILWEDFLTTNKFSSVLKQFEVWKWQEREEMIQIYVHSQTDSSHDIKLSNKDFFRMLSGALYKWGIEQKESDPFEVKCIQERIFKKIIDTIRKEKIPIVDCAYKFRGQSSEDFLKKMPEGAFCIRKRVGKGKKGTFSLSVSKGYKKGVVHYELKQNLDGTFSIEGVENKKFKTVGDLLKNTHIKFPAYPDVIKERVKKRENFSDTQMGNYNVFEKTNVSDKERRDLTEAGVFPVSRLKEKTEKNLENGRKSLMEAGIFPVHPKAKVKEKAIKIDLKN